MLFDTLKSKSIFFVSKINKIVTNTLHTYIFHYTFQLQSNNLHQLIVSIYIIHIYKFRSFNISSIKTVKTYNCFENSIYLTFEE